MVTLGAATAVAYALGRSGVQEAEAVPPHGNAVQTPSQPAPAQKTDAGDPNRLVAVIYNNIHLTRQDFGEYLIARESKKLDLFINKCVIDHYCQEHGVSVTDAEMDAQILEDLGKMSVTPRQLLDQILKSRNMTFYEWREDVIRPQLMMKKIVRNLVSVTADDLKKAYEAEFGEKRECRIIIWRPGIAQDDLVKIYQKISNDEGEFERAASHQADAGLAAGGGALNKPVSHYSLRPDIERTVFALQPGEMTAILQDGDNRVVFKCDKIIPPVDNPPPLESVRDKYVELITESKIRDEIPKVCKELRERAKVSKCLDAGNAEEQWLNQAEKQYKAKTDATGTLDMQH